MEINLTIEDAGANLKEDEVKRLLQLFGFAAIKGFKVTCCDRPFPADRIPPRPVDERVRQCRSTTCEVKWKWPPKNAAEMQEHWDRIYSALITMPKQGGE